MGQIVGIVIGVIAGVALIVGLVLCCIGYHKDWECVDGTRIGICIGMVLKAIQACINARVFARCEALFAQCDCENGLPEDNPGTGGAMSDDNPPADQEMEF